MRPFKENLLVKLSPYLISEEKAIRQVRDIISEQSNYNHYNAAQHKSVTGRYQSAVFGYHGRIVNCPLIFFTRRIYIASVVPVAVL